LSWLKRERIKILNYIISVLKKHGELTEEDLLREVMRESWLSRKTVKQYIDDLIFIGRITRNNNHLKISEEEEE